MIQHVFVLKHHRNACYTGEAKLVSFILEFGFPIKIGALELIPFTKSLTTEAIFCCNDLNNVIIWQKKKEKHSGHMIKCLLTELGRARRENIWYLVMALSPYAMTSGQIFSCPALLLS